MRNTWLFGLLISVLALLLLVGCAPASQTIEVTKIVSEISEMEVTRIVEVDQEVTRLVEIAVEVTRLVEKVVIITPTPPPPTNTAEAPAFGAREKPYPINNTAQMAGADGIPFEFTLLEVLRGDEAWQRICTAHSMAEPAPEGAEWILYKAGVTNTGTGSDLLEFEGSDIDIVSQNRIFSVSDAYNFDDHTNPKLAFDLLPGGYGEGWYAMAVPIDPQATFLLDGAHFTAAVDQIVIVETATPEPETCTKVEYRTAVKPVVDEFTRLFEGVGLGEISYETGIAEFGKLSVNAATIECGSSYPESHAQLLLTIATMKGALEAFQAGDTDTALAKMDVVSAMVRELPTTLTNE